MDWQEAQKHWGILADAISELIKKVESEIGSQNFRAVNDRHSLSKIDKKLYEALHIANKAYESYKAE